MNIIAKHGTRVMYTGNGGYDVHKEHANLHLTVGTVYTVKKTIVRGWYTDVILIEFDNERFNSVFFDDI